jgi:hypothetical protein
VDDVQDYSLAVSPPSFMDDDEEERRRRLAGRNSLGSRSQDPTLSSSGRWSSDLGLSSSGEPTSLAVKPPEPDRSDSASLAVHPPHMDSYAQLQPENPLAVKPPDSSQTLAATRQRNGIPTSASTDIANVLTPPNLQPIARPALLDAPRHSLEGFKSRMAEPVNESLNTTAGGPISLDQPGSAGFYADKIARIEDAKANPWGSPENHPGTLGKIGHVLGRIGNIAGDIAAPNAMAIIPGTDLNRQVQESGLENRFETASNRENRAAETEEQRRIEERRNEILDRRNDVLEGRQPKQTPDEAAIADLQTQVNPSTGKPYTAYEARVKLAQSVQDTKPAGHTSPFEAFAYGTPEEKKAAQDFLSLEKSLGAKYQKPDEVERRYALFKKDPDSYRAMYGDRGQANEDRQANADRSHATAMLRFFEKQRDEISKDFMLGDDEKAAKLKELDELQKPFMETARGGGGGGKNDRVNVIDPDGRPGTIPRSQLDKAKKKGYRVAQ